MDSAFNDLNNHTTLYGAEAWARGTKGGVDVGSTDPTYHNNSKYYSEVSKGHADYAEAQAERAESAVPVGTDSAILWTRAQTIPLSGRTQARTNMGIPITELYVQNDVLYLDGNIAVSGNTLAIA